MQPRAADLLSQTTIGSPLGRTSGWDRTAVGHRHPGPNNYWLASRSDNSGYSCGAAVRATDLPGPSCHRFTTGGTTGGTTARDSSDDRWSGHRPSGPNNHRLATPGDQLGGQPQVTARGTDGRNSGRKTGGTAVGHRPPGPNNHRFATRVGNWLGQPWATDLLGKTTSSSPLGGTTRETAGGQPQATDLLGQITTGSPLGGSLGGTPVRDSSGDRWSGHRPPWAKQP